MPEHVSRRPIAHARARLFGIVLLAGLTIVWGCNWPVMKVALQEVPVWWFRTTCVVFGGLGLLTITAITRQPILLRWRDIPSLICVSIFAIMGWHIFTGYGVTHMPAGRASIIAYTMPVWAALFSVFVLGERLRMATLAGLFFGLSGLAVLMGPRFRWIAVGTYWGDFYAGRRHIMGLWHSSF